MTARRPYASRGVPRPASTRRTGRPFRYPHLALIVVVPLGVVLAVGVAWAAINASSAPLPAPRLSQDTTRAGPSTPVTAAQQELPLQAAEPAAAGAPVGTTPTSLPVLSRQ